MKFTKNKGFAVEAIVIAVFAILLLAFIIYPLATSFNDTQYTVEITNKERVEDKYLIFCEDENGVSYVFENTDSLLRGKWNSSDIYGDMKVGNTYTVTVVGYRIPFLSEYQNIISYEKV